jgi:AcrR family transcriptional regulator
MSASDPPTMRERYRAQVRQEVKQAALRQLEQSGPAGLSVSAIGKELGVSGPALYRYFSSRDDLLTELVIDAYDDLADALRAAVSQAPPEPRARFEILLRSYRSWALGQPHRYRLLYGPPLPGYDAHVQRLVGAAQAAMNLMLDALRDLGDPSAQPLPSPALAAQLAAWVQAHDPGLEPTTALRAVFIWSWLHGFVSLEIAGNFASMGIDPGEMFQTQLAVLAT